MKYKFLFTAFAVIAGLLAHSQNLVATRNTGTTSLQRCSTTAKMEQAMNHDAALMQRRTQLEVDMQNWISNNAAAMNSKTLITIPVVIHVVYRTNTGNISDAQIISQIDALNRDYRRMNTDTGNTPAVFKPVATDVGIQFCLASLDPNGNATTGIIRSQTTINNIGNTNSYYSTSAGGQDIWNRNKYLNIWVCEIGGGTLGFAYQPGVSASYDGVVIDYRYFGTMGTVTSPYNKGRTATHEVGHWFNLDHVWGPGNSSCTQDDGVSDTPMQQTANYGCPSHPHVSCSNSGDQFMNYMDYVDDNCMNMFSAGQKTRMLAAINSSRSGLLTSNGCSASALSANFNASSTSVSAGGSINFSDLSSGNPTNWQWTFQGGTPTTSVAQNPTNITYSTAGTYEVSLTIWKNGQTASEVKTAYITVGTGGGTSTCDTLNSPFLGTPVLYTETGGGYVAGNNSYGDLAKAEFFQTTSSGTLSGVSIGFAAANASSSNATISVKVWSNNAGTPGTVLATKTVNLNSIVTDVANGNLTLVTFTNPVNVSSTFFVGIVLNQTSGNEVALYTSTDGDRATNTAWEQWSDNSWNDYVNAWGLTLSHLIMPYYCSAPPCNLTLATSTTSVSCFAGSTGSASVTASSGTIPYTYAWSNGTSNTSINNVSAGTYSVTVTDAAQCQLSATVQVTQPAAALSSTANLTNETVNGNDGSITVNATGGTMPYSYIWSNGGSSATVNGLQGGTYTVTITDANDCFIYNSYNLASSVGVDELGNSALLRVFPNPASHSITVQLEGYATTSAVQLVDVTGKVVYSDSANLSNNYSIALSEYTSGVYMLKVTNDKGLNSIVKLMIVH